jgi:hypothetical protein
MTKNQLFCRHRTALSSLAAALLLSSPAPLLATDSTNSNTNTTCKVKIEGKGFVISQESTQAFRFNFKFELKDDGEIKGQFRGYDCATRITLASRQPIAITEAGDGSWVVDFEASIGTNGTDMARLIVSDGGKRARDTFRLELSDGSAISGEVGRGTRCKDGNIKIKEKCKGRDHCEGHPECEEHRVCVGAPNCKGRPKCNVDKCKGHKECWTVKKHKKSCKAPKNPKIKCKCPKHVLKH